MKWPKIPTFVIALVVGGALLCALPYLLVGGVLSYEVAKERLSRISFDASAWQDSAQVFSTKPVRIRMVDDLLERHDLLGMYREQVVALLGEPGPTDYFSDYDLVYWLGRERGFFSIDSEWLVVRLDEQGRVVEHRITTD